MEGGRKVRARAPAIAALLLVAACAPEADLVELGPGGGAGEVGPEAVAPGGPPDRGEVGAAADDRVMGSGAALPARGMLPFGPLVPAFRGSGADFYSADCGLDQGSDPVCL